MAKADADNDAVPAALLDYWPLRVVSRTHKQRAPNGLRLLLEKLPMLALAAGSAAATMIAQHDALSSGERCR